MKAQKTDGYCADEDTGLLGSGRTPNYTGQPIDAGPYACSFAGTWPTKAGELVGIQGPIHMCFVFVFIAAIRNSVKSRPSNFLISAN